jgi:hypothetical protein
MNKGRCPVCGETISLYQNILGQYATMENTGEDDWPYETTDVVVIHYNGDKQCSECYFVGPAAAFGTSEWKEPIPNRGGELILPIEIEIREGKLVGQIEQTRFYFYSREKEVDISILEEYNLMRKLLTITNEGELDQIDDSLTWYVKVIKRNQIMLLKGENPFPLPKELIIELDMYYEGKI